MSDIDPEGHRTWDAWHKRHQPFEIGWWREALETGHCDNETFWPHWHEVAAWIEPKGSVLDIGCGPRPPFSPCTVIEPLAEQYRAITPAEWWDEVEVFAQPAETLIKDRAFDTVICWNCIDHAIGWKKILANMATYAARPHGRIAIATDFWPPFLGHPGFEREAFMEEIDRHFDVIKTKEPFGRALALLLKVK
jgi:2-polyprenyl-3-methyl-5-hydroxy-6-metoxy-1,4-benzoquinol methylase